MARLIPGQDIVYEKQRYRIVGPKPNTKCEEWYLKPLSGGEIITISKIELEKLIGETNADQAIKSFTGLISASTWHLGGKRSSYSE